MMPNPGVPFYPKYLIAKSIDLFKPWALWVPRWHPPQRILSLRNNPASRVDFWVACHMPIELEVMFTDHAGNALRFSFTAWLLIWQSFQQYLRTLITKGSNLPLQLTILYSCLTAIEQVSEQKWLGDLNLCPSAHNIIVWIRAHNTVGYMTEL